MWKLQHPDGQREINELHVPVGQPVKLTMTSQDVIHSFFVPAFAIKQDVLPGRYTSIWFQATKPGKYHLFCAEYCGTKHSGMIGWVYAMEPHDYQRGWTEGGAEGSLASTGEKLFHQFGCANCHHFDGQGRCPILRESVRTAGADRERRDRDRATKPISANRSSTRAPSRRRVSADHADLRGPADGRTGDRADRVYQGHRPAARHGEAIQLRAPLRRITERRPGIAGPGATSISGSKPGTR